MTTTTKLYRVPSFDEAKQSVGWDWWKISMDLTKINILTVRFSDLSQRRTTLVFHDFLSEIKRKQSWIKFNNMKLFMMIIIYMGWGDDHFSIALPIQKPILFRYFPDCPYIPTIRYPSSITIFENWCCLAPNNNFLPVVVKNSIPSTNFFVQT